MQISYDGSATIGSSSHHSLSGLSAVSVGSSVGKAKLPAQGILRLHIIRAESLPHVHLSPSTGPYLAIAYGKTRHKTCINTVGGVNPQWNECFELYVSSSDARKQSVLFTVKNKKVASNGGGGGGGGAEDDNRSIISAISTAGGGGGSSILGIANVKLISLCAKERTLLIPLRRIGSSKPAGCIKARVSFEAWNAGRANLGRNVENTTDLRGGATPAANPFMANTNTGSNQSLQHHAKQQLMMMTQQPPTHRPSMPPMQQTMMMDMDQRDDYGPVTPSPPQPRPTMPASAARVPPRSGLPPRGPSSTGRHGGYYRLEESFEDMQLVDAAPVHRRNDAGKSPKVCGRGSRHNSSPNRNRGGGNRRRDRGRGHDHSRDRNRSSHRRAERRRDCREGDDRDDSTARRDDVPSIVDCYDDEDDDHSAIDESEFSEDYRRGGRIVEQGYSWERAKVARPRVYDGNPRDALVSTSKFLCF